MAETPTRNPPPAIAEPLALVALAALLYIAAPMAGVGKWRPASHFHQLAQAFLHGRTSIEIPRGAGRRLDELIPASKPHHYHCAYPPLPALILLPFVAVFGSAVKVDLACRVISVMNVFLFWTCFRRVPARLGLPPLGTAPRIALNVLFAFGTVCWHNALIGGDWHLAHAVAMAAMLLALREYGAADRPLVVGGLLGLALLARPTTVLAGLFFAMPLVRARAVPRLVKLAAGPAAAVLLLALYNQVRFGSPTDFGYDRMILRGMGAALMDEYGQFHPHFVLKNAFWFFLAPPWPVSDGRFPFVGYDPHGLGLFFATPAFLYVFVAFGRRWRCDPVRDAAIGAMACLIPLLLYFNTGYLQFGHRFGMDYLPLLMVLIVAGMGSVPGRLAYGLIAASIAFQAVGVLFDPVTQLPAWLTPGP